MKRVLSMVLVLALAGGIALAGGDKVRGDKGQGDVNQNQVMDPPPFQDEDSLDFFLWLFE